MKNASGDTMSRVKLADAAPSYRASQSVARLPAARGMPRVSTGRDTERAGCPYNGSINNGTRTTSMRTTGSSGSMALLTEFDDATARELRSLRLESTEDGKGILLIEVDERKPGIHREVRYEITPAELIAAIRAHGAELPGEQHNHRT
jgi:hypothetical protein